MQHAFQMMFNSQYRASINRAFCRCDSPIEGNLLHCLLKGYRAHDICQQFEVGKYRLDFATADGIGWELDGKPFHDTDRDAKRDRWILDNSQISCIVRVQASALMFYSDACLAAISKFVAHMQGAAIYCTRDAERAIEEALSYNEGYQQGYYDWNVIEDFARGEAFEVVGTTAYVGSPFAFLPTDNPLWEAVPALKRGLFSWRGTIRKVI